MKAVKPERMAEIVEELEDINYEMGQLVERLSRICDEVGDSNARAYLIANLEIVVEQGSWLHRDLTLPQWIKRLQEPEEDFAYEEDEFM